MSSSSKAPSSPERKPNCTIEYEGAEVPAVAGEPIAVALIANGARVLSRSIKYHRPRSFFCLAGHCNGCLMRVGGVPNVKACRAPASPGLVVERQNAFPSGSFDVLGAADWFFPAGMDHHTMMTSSTTLNAVLRRVVREVGGLGKLPDASTVPAELPRGTRRHVDVVIVGAGPAGLAAAIAIGRATGGKKSVLVVDEGDRAGGSLLSHPDHGPRAADALVGEARSLGVELKTSAPAFGYYPEESTLAVNDRGHLLSLTAERYIYATGGYDVNALFEDNDRPGICAGRAVGLLLARYGVVPGRRPIVLGRGAYALALRDALTRAGCEVSHVDGEAEKPIAATGANWVSALRVQAGGAPKKIPCDLIAVVEPPAPASELARMHGIDVALSVDGGGFACVVDESGAAPGGGGAARACGDVCGYRGVLEARAHGERVGRAVAATLTGAR